MNELLARIEGVARSSKYTELAREIGHLYTREQVLECVHTLYSSPRYSWATGDIYRNLVEMAMLRWDIGIDSMRPLGDNERRCKCGAIIWLDPDFGIESHRCD